MVVGFNHNIRYRDVIFHVQTEDGGLDNPFITTLLYRGGTIVASKKTGYADIIKVEMLERVVEEVMQEQHKEMLRRLKRGEFDDRAFPEVPDGASCAPPADLPPADGPDPSPPPERNLDDVILDYLTSDGDK